MNIKYTVNEDYWLDLGVTKMRHLHLLNVKSKKIIIALYLLFWFSYFSLILLGDYSYIYYGFLFIIVLVLQFLSYKIYKIRLNKVKVPFLTKISLRLRYKHSYKELLNTEENIYLYIKKDKINYRSLLINKTRSIKRLHITHEHVYDYKYLYIRRKDIGDNEFDKLVHFLTIETQ